MALAAWYLDQYLLACYLISIQKIIGFLWLYASFKNGLMDIVLQHF